MNPAIAVTWISELVDLFRPGLPLLFNVVFPAAIAVFAVWLFFELRGNRRHSLLYVKIIGKGVTHTGLMRLGNPHTVYEHGGREYEVREKDLFKVSAGLGWLGDKIRGTVQRYAVFFREGDTENAVTPYFPPGEQKGYGTPAETLLIIYRSRALKNALSSMFKADIGVKKILFVVAVAGAMLLLLSQLGYIDLGFSI